MGCDIHLCVEKRVDGEWVAVKREHEWYKEKTVDWLWHGRNYSLFAILADVRNGYGVAGVDTGEGYIPISQPRGLPFGTSDEVRGEAQDWGYDGHSHSWLTLRELQEYDWQRVTKRVGWVNDKEYAHFREHGRPREWSGGVSGRSVMHLTNEMMDALLDGHIIKRDDLYYYTLVEWEETYRESVKHALDEIMPKLVKLGDPDDVRIVFWFDN